MVRPLTASAGTALRVVRSIFDRRRGAIRFVIVTSTACLAFDTLFLTVIITGKYLLGTHDEIVDVTRISLFAVLVFAPLFENICFIGIVEFLKAFDLEDTTLVLIVSAISAVLHGIAGGWRAVSGATGFATMTYSYLLWNGEPFLKRYAITVSQHCLLNTPPALLLCYLQ